MPARKVRPIHYIAYGLTDILGAGSMAVVAGWILFFYAAFCNLSAVQASAIFSISRLLDAVWSPLVGHFSDSLANTKLGRRFGRRRLFLLIAIPLLPSFALMWVSGQSFLYYLCTYVFFELVYASVLVPYGTLAPEMTDDYKELSIFAGVRMLFAQVSAIMAGILPKMIISVVGGKDSPDTFLIMGIIFAVLFMIVVLVTYLFSWERDNPPQARAAMARRSAFAALGRLWLGIGSTLKVRAFRLHLGMYLGGYICQDIFNAAFTYFVVYAVLGSVAVASSMMGAMAFTQLVAVAAFIPLILWLQPAPSYRLACLFYALGIVGLYAIYQMHPGDILTLLYFPVLIAGLGRGGLNFIPWNIYNYIADVDEVVTGQRREGIFAGVMIFTRKTTMAVAVMIVGILLDAAGFHQGATQQTPGAINMIVGLMTIGPLLLIAFGFAVSLRFKLDKRTHAMLTDAIQRFKAGDRTPANTDTKAAVEDLTGFSYDSLWGNNAVLGAKR